MQLFLFALLMGVSICLLTACGVLFVECVVACFARSSQRHDVEQALRIAVVVPAHNEQLSIHPTVEAIMADLAGSDRLLVVADNCVDDTAALASAAGAEVIERADSERRGKGYALAFAIQHLAAAPPDVVVFVDADCRLAAGALRNLAHQSYTTARPAQACYLMQVPPQPGARDFISAFAFQVKNHVRLLGMSVLGLPCHLTGSGMALPWECLDSVTLATGEIVEDMRLGIELMINNRSPRFCRDATVWSLLPQDRTAARSQRTRWEHGHVFTLFARVPQLLYQGLRQRRLELLLVAFDLAVPPLALLVVLLTITGLLAVASQAWMVVAVTLASLGLLCGSATIAWLRFARSTIPLKALLSIPLYICCKLPIYVALVFRRQTRWIRTERDSVVPPPLARRRGATATDGAQPKHRK